MLDSDETSADESSLELNDNCTEPFGCQPQHENDWKPIVHNDIKPQNSMFSLILTGPVLILLQSFSAMRTLTRSVSILPRNSEISAMRSFILLESRRKRSLQEVLAITSRRTIEKDHGQIFTALESACLRPSH